jgi:hypothetical protein
MPNHTPPDSELLTPDEQLIHHKRWTGEPTDLKTALRNLAKVHNLADDLDIDELEKWDEYFDELVTVIGQLVQANPSLPDSAPDDVLRDILTEFAPRAEESFHLTGSKPYFAIKEEDLPKVADAIRAAIQSALPEKIEPEAPSLGYKGDSEGRKLLIEWRKGRNDAIDTMTANLKSKGLL